MSGPLLSLCMIVKDEEKMLPDCLRSVAGLWDELVVADTGSQDGTARILAETGARVIAHRWADDFAAARNAALAAAQGRWILSLDADERVSPELVRQIRDLLKDDRAGAATVVMRNNLPGGLHREADLLRIFRNDPRIRFRHRIHEDVLDDVTDYLARTGLLLRRLTGQVLHLGYERETATDRGKRRRDRELLQRTLAADPHDFYCWFKLLEQARFWDDKELWGEAAGQAATHLTGALPASARRDLARNVWSGELAALISQGLFPAAADALAWLDSSRELVRPGAAWHLRRAQLFESLGQGSAAGDAFASALAATRPGADPVRVRARLGLCRLAAAANEPDRARSLALEAVQSAPGDREALLAVVTFVGLAQGQDAVRAFAERHVGAHPGAAEPLAESLLRAGHAAVALAILTAAAARCAPLALGQLTCALALAQPVELAVDLDQAEADDAFRHWIRVLWESRRTELMVAFAENSVTVAEAFPWLQDYLAAETARLGR